MHPSRLLSVLHSGHFLGPYKPATEPNFGPFCVPCTFLPDAPDHLSLQLTASQLSRSGLQAGHRPSIPCTLTSGPAFGILPMVVGIWVPHSPGFLRTPLLTEPLIHGTESWMLFANACADKLARLGARRHTVAAPQAGGCYPGPNHGLVSSKQGHYHWDALGSFPS